MSRLNKKKNKFDSDIDYSVEVDKIKPYSEDEAYSVYVPPTPKKKKMGKGKKAVLIILIIFLILIIAGVVGLLVLEKMGERMVSYDDVQISGIEDSVSQDDGKTVAYNGKNYRLNENITSIACMGIDRENLGTYNDKIGTAGQSDTNMVLVIDTETGKVTIISIPRDTMVDVDLYTTKGEYVGSEYEQLCLAYAYGDGKEKSCENAVASIQRVLFGMPVNSYISLDMDGIGAINDSIGGVTVTSPETIAQFYEGQSVTLRGDDALTFVRERGTDLNASLRRMDRQRAYVTAFAQKAVSAAKSNISTINRLYNVTMKYCCTNVGLSNVTYLGTTLISKGVSSIDMVSIPGEMKQGDTYTEYYMDTTATYELILSIFYNEVA